MSQLTQEEKRIKLAEWAGWSNIHDEVCPAITYNWGIDPHGERRILPDYFYSLDDVHLLENTLLTTARLDEEYYFALKRNHRATAAERAEAVFQVISFFK